MDTSRPVAAFSEFTHFAGFDWASEKHDVAVVDGQGKLLLQLEFSDTAEGWSILRTKLAALVAPAKLSGRVGVAIESSRGPAVERLLDMGLTVYPMNPKAAERFRDRKAPSGAKDDPLDAWSFADALRTDGHDWRPLLPDDLATQELRILCRDEIGLIQERTALVLRLLTALHEYYPAALAAFDDWTMPSAWDFILRFPTPADLVRKGKRAWEKFLHTHRLGHPETYAKRLAIFTKADEFVSPSTAVTNAKSLLAQSIVKQLKTLQEQLHEYRARIEEAFAKHPDHDTFDSLPGAGPKLAPRLLGELGANRPVFPSAEDLQCYAGTAPVTIKSGKQRWAKLRRACNMTLRFTVHLWVDESRHWCAWAQAYYQKKRGEGHRHAEALRALGQRWLKILWKMWQDHTTYDEARHLLAQTTHGSWVIGLLPETPPAAAKTPATASAAIG
jgi:transposase